jgi:hypothetical protein
MFSSIFASGVTGSGSSVGLTFSDVRYALSGSVTSSPGSTEIALPRSTASFQLLRCEKTEFAD